jgi:hypothetical protein
LKTLYAAQRSTANVGIKGLNDAKAIVEVPLRTSSRPIPKEYTFRPIDKMADNHPREVATESFETLRPRRPWLRQSRPALACSNRFLVEPAIARTASGKFVSHLPHLRRAKIRGATVRPQGCWLYRIEISQHQSADARHANTMK